MYYDERGRFVKDMSLPTEIEIKRRENQLKAITGKPSWNSGKKMSPEHKKSLIAGQLKSRLFGSKSGKKVGRLKGIIPWNKGLKFGPMSDAEKLKRSIAAKGKPKSEITKQRMREAKKLFGGPNLGRKLPLEWRENISKGGKGRRFSEITKSCMRKPKSEEHRRRIIEARKLRIFPFRDTKPEKMLQIALSLEGIEFEKHKLFKIRDDSYHRVDLFIKPNICVEVDGIYWHSRPEAMKRDLEVNHVLTSQGYLVIRIDDKTIIKNVNQSALNIINLIKTQVKSEVMR